MKQKQVKAQGGGEVYVSRKERFPEGEQPDQVELGDYRKLRVPDELYSGNVKLREINVPHIITVSNNKASVWHFQEFMGAGGFGIVLKYKRVHKKP